MRIDWHQGKWRVWTLDGAKLHEAEHVHIRVPVELVNADNGTRGYLIVNGHCRELDGTLLIEHQAYSPE